MLWKQEGDFDYIVNGKKALKDCYKEYFTWK